MVLLLFLGALRPSTSTAADVIVERARTATAGATPPFPSPLPLAFVAMPPRAPAMKGGIHSCHVVHVRTGVYMYILMVQVVA